VASQSNSVPTKTIVLVRETNQLVGATTDTRSVGVWSDATVLPGETLRALTKRPDGEMVAHYGSLFTRIQSGNVTTSSSFGWILKEDEGFGAAQAESATTQIRERFTKRPLTLRASTPLEVFCVTNPHGATLTGYIQFEQVSPQPPDAAGQIKTRVQIQNASGYRPAIYYSAVVPPGCALYATASEGTAFTHTSAGPSDFYSSWSPVFRPGRYMTGTGEVTWHVAKKTPADPPGGLVESETPAVPQPTANSGAAARIIPTPPIPLRPLRSPLRLPGQLEFAPFDVVLGEPKLVFSIINGPGDVYQGFLELVGPPDAAHESARSVSASRVLTQAPFSAKLPDAEVELWAISRFEPGKTNRVLWRPDGSTMGAATRRYDGSVNLPDRDLYELAFRVGVQTNGLPDVILESLARSGAEPAGLRGSDGAQRVADTIFHQVLSCEPGLAKASLRVGVAAGPWETRRQLDFSSGSLAGSEGVIMRTVIPGERETSVVCDYQELKGWQTRLIALGANGEIKPIRVGSWMSLGSTAQYSATFLSEAIQGAKLHLQRRPYHWVEFHNVSLKPGQRTQVEVRDAAEKTRDQAPAVRDGAAEKSAVEDAGEKTQKLTAPAAVVPNR